MAGNLRWEGCKFKARLAHPSDKRPAPGTKFWGAKILAFWIDLWIIILCLGVPEAVLFDMVK